MTHTKKITNDDKHDNAPGNDVHAASPKPLEHGSSILSFVVMFFVFVSFNSLSKQIYSMMEHDKNMTKNDKGR